VEHPGPDGREVALDEDVEGVDQTNGQRVDEDGEAQEPVLVLDVDHAQDQEHNEENDVDERWPVHRHQE